MRSRIPLLVTLLASASLIGTSLPAHAADEPVVPVNGATTFTGHGFGHGRGMSQYGAQGAAIRGIKAGSILGFYYPGTTLTTVTGYIKVWLRGDIDADTIVLPKTGLELADYGQGKAFKLPTTLGAKAWKLTGSGVSGGFKVSYQNNGWHPYLPGGKALVGYAEFRNSLSYTVTLRTPSGDKSYRGAIQRRNSHTINRTGYDSYVKGVVASEMPPTWRLEALKSQAIAARTFGAYSVQDSSGPTDTYNVDDTTAFQVYGGLSAETTKTNQAVSLTAAKILTYSGAPDNDPAYTQFSSSNGGYTVAGATKPYLVAKPDTFEQYSSNPYANWTYAAPQAALQSKLVALAANSTYHTALGTLTGLQVVARDGNGQWGGRVTSIRLIGTTGQVVVDGSDLRVAIGLRSTWFSLAD